MVFYVQLYRINTLPTYKWVNLDKIVYKFTSMFALLLEPIILLQHCNKH